MLGRDMLQRLVGALIGIILLLTPFACERALAEDRSGKGTHVTLEMNPEMSQEDDSGSLMSLFPNNPLIFDGNNDEEEQ